jgi:DNA-binding HxlR family transcriptional regulator
MRTTYSQEQIIRTKDLAKIIGDVSNILILYELMNFGEKSFNELKRMTDINAVTLSKKLSILKLEGLVGSHECGKENRYFVTENSEELRPLIMELEKLVLKN